MRVTLVHNAGAGQGEHGRKALVAALEAAGYEVDYVDAKAEGFAEAIEDPGGLLLVAGGDGTVARTAATLADRTVPLVILPLGTANNLARGFDIAGHVGDFLAGWRDGRLRRLDVGTAEGPWGEAAFVEAVGCGALAATMEAEADGDEDRLLAGRRAFARALEEAPALETSVRLDGIALPGRWLMVEVLNIRHSGPCLPLAPAAEPGDGALDVLCLPEEGRDAMLAWLDAPEAAPPPVAPRRARRVEFAWDGAVPLRLDDALQKAPKKGRTTTVTVTLQPVPVAVLVPGEALP